jgi:DNA replication protein DnaC
MFAPIRQRGSGPWIDLKSTVASLPQPLPDTRETQSLLVHKDFAVRFDGNTYTAPPWAIGKSVIVKADVAFVSLYLNDKRIAVHPRCWERKQRIETPSHRQQVKKLRKKLWHDRQVAALMSLGTVAVDYLNGLLDAGQPITKQVKRLLVLKDKYGAEALVYALTKSMAHKALGADYVENIVHQEMAPKNDQPPVRLKNEQLNRIRLNQPSLAEYDAHALKGRKNNGRNLRKGKTLRLKTIADQLPPIVETAESNNWPFSKTIAHLFDLEIETRRQNRIALCYRQSKLNEKLTIDQFDFNHHSSRKKQKTRILNLMSLGFLKEKMDIILIGNPGVGKSFLAKAAAYAATQAGIKVLFTTAMDMINHLIAADADHSLLKKLHYYQSPELLVVDEIGYLGLGKQGSNLFFQVISQRHETRSTAITTNLAVCRLGKIFDSTTVATAIADRLVYNSQIFILEGPSYRKRTKPNNP